MIFEKYASNLKPFYGLAVQTTTHWVNMQVNKTLFLQAMLMNRIAKFDGKPWFKSNRCPQESTSISFNRNYNCLLIDSHLEIIRIMIHVFA